MTWRRTRSLASFVLAGAALSGGLLCAASPARAFPAFAAEIPCRATAVNSGGILQPCITCHNNPDGGAGCMVDGVIARPCLNDFGLAFRTNNTTWNAALAGMDSDGDGYTNGEELGDPTGTWSPGQPDPAICACATRPGFLAFSPASGDADRDGFCCRGRDTNADFDCLDESEHDTSADCDDARATASPAAAEICTNVEDDDCDGLPTLRDPQCEGVVDRDGDGHCPMGRDLNGDADCIDDGEAAATGDCDDLQVTVFPGAFENCLDGLDNDCDTATDRADDVCRSDIDADNDGYCPIGRDTNDDGDCTDEGEEAAGLDCNDGDAAANPGQTENCTDAADNDCDGLTDFRDEGCRAYFDEDRDGFCPAGRDGNGDRDCVDTDEVAEPGDCNDADVAVHPAHTEVCTNAIDDNCDQLVSLRDPMCATYLDADGDRYCFVGYDTNDDGDCADGGEAPAAGDCDETSVDVRPGVTELCTNGLDDDCDGSTDAFDPPTCNDYRDRDGDGYCPLGRDGNDDGDCADAAELQEPNDSGHDAEPTVFPGAPEHCFDHLDNDLDGDVDEAAACVRDHDVDSDGFCPVGRDVNGDGDCLDAGENYALSDCNDASAEVNPGASEACRENTDRDCDADIGLVDTDCYGLLDRDHDGFCGIGVDDNNNGSCLDEGEDRFGVDCDDSDPNIHARAAEVCDNGIDDDCDGRIDQRDRSCPCLEDAVCDDGDACTDDTCSNGTCVWSQSAACAGDGGTDMMPMDGCSCRAVHADGNDAGWLALGLLGWALHRHRRRHRRRRA